MRSKQFNFYVHPEEEKDLFEYLQSFPRMVRSSTIKTILINHMKKGASLHPNFDFSSTQRNTQKLVNDQNFNKNLQFNGQIELDESDLL